MLRMDDCCSILLVEMAGSVHSLIIGLFTRRPASCLAGFKPNGQCQNSGNSALDTREFHHEDTSDV